MSNVADETKDAKQTEKYAQNLHKICIIAFHAITMNCLQPTSRTTVFGEIRINKCCGNTAIVYARLYVCGMPS